MKRGLLVPLLLFLPSVSKSAFTKVYSAPMDVQDNGPENVRPVAFSQGLLSLDAGKDGFVSSGTLTLPSVQTPAFDSFVASWNADVPAGTSVEVFGRIHRIGSWSEWHSFGRWTSDGGSSVEKQ